MTIGRTALGINKTDGRHEERANRVRRCVAASLSDNGGQPSRISCQDLPKALCGRSSVTFDLRQCDQHPQGRPERGGPYLEEIPRPRLS